MNKTTFILLITLIISYINTAYIQAQTQRVTVQGSILEKDTQFPVEQAGNAFYIITVGQG